MFQAAGEGRGLGNQNGGDRTHQPESLAALLRQDVAYDIGPNEVGSYRERRLLRDGAAQKTVSLEIGTPRAMMLHYDLDSNWSSIRKKIKLKKARNLGRVITAVEETVLLQECRSSRSRSLYVAVVLAFETCMRYSEIRLLSWHNADLARRVITVGKSKTDAGEGRVIPLTRAAYETLRIWAATFPDRKPNHFVFPSEQYGQGAAVYRTDPTRPIGTWKEAWEAAKRRAGVECRFHDCRHTGCSRLLDAGVSHPVVAEIMGWSSSTAIRMIKDVYGHIGLSAKQRAMELVEQAAGKSHNTFGVGTEMGTFEEETISRFSRWLKRLAPQVGLEPTTLRLTAGCSAIELLRSVAVRAARRCA